MNIKYNLKQKTQIKLAMYIMPIITKLLVSHRLNTFVWKMLGVKIGKNSIIRTGAEINAPFMLEIGNDCVTNLNNNSAVLKGMRLPLSSYLATPFGV